MAWPPQENYTGVPNEILEAAFKYKFNGTQFRIILVIWRYTYGFHRREHEFSLSFIAKAAGIHKNQVDRELSALIARKVVLVVSESTYTQSRILMINRECSLWGDSNTLTVSGLDDTPVSGLDDTPVSGLVDQEIKVLNKNIKERLYVEMTIPYKEIIEYLNQKTGKRYSFKSEPTRKLISGRFSEGRTLEDFIYVIDTKVSHWLDDHKMKEYLRPTTLFCPTNFDKYLNQTPKIARDPFIESRDREVEFQRWVEEGNDPDGFDWS